MGHFKSQRLALNMFWCAFLLWPWGVLPRETISGFFGRRQGGESRVATSIANLIDWLHPHERLHCFSTFALENEARKILYPEEV
jgi:hypothetical protein